MKCRICGAEIPNGELRCPVCHAEVQLVPDYNYNSVEYMLKQQNIQNKLKEEQEKKQEIPKVKKKKKSVWKGILITLLIIVGCVILAFFAKYYIDNKNHNDFDYQMRMSRETYDSKNYADALEYAKQALRLNPESLEAKLLQASILMAQKDYGTAKQTLRSIIGTDPENIEAYGDLIAIFEMEGDKDSIKNLMDDCESETVRTSYADYICSSPAFSPAEGTYKTKIQVSLSADEGDTVYYTTDGTDPTESSTVYKNPIATSEGRNEIRAIAINEKGIKSDVVLHVYNVTLVRPNPPAVTPASGDYTAGTTITVTVPSGCKAYYAFDATPTINSTLYTVPVKMTSGTHIFSVIIQDENGKISIPTSETYVVNN